MALCRSSMNYTRTIDIAWIDGLDCGLRQLWLTSHDTLGAHSRSVMNHPIHIHLALCELLCFSEGKTRPSKRSNIDKFLSNLALLLNGNETCTTIYVHRANKEVVVARNQRIDPTDELFSDRFFDSYEFTQVWLLMERTSRQSVISATN